MEIVNHHFIQGKAALDKVKKIEHEFDNILFGSKATLLDDASTQFIENSTIQRIENQPQLALLAYQSHLLKAFTGVLHESVNQQVGDIDSKVLNEEAISLGAAFIRVLWSSTATGHLSYSC